MRKQVEKSLFSVVNLHGKGRGLQAMTAIPGGVVLFREKPISGLLQLQHHKKGLHCPLCLKLTRSCCCHPKIEEISSLSDWRTRQALEHRTLMPMARQILSRYFLDCLEERQPSIWEGYLAKLCYPSEFSSADIDTDEYDKWIEVVSEKKGIVQEIIRRIAPLEMYVRILGVLNLNVHAADRDDGDPLGYVLMGLGSLVNHSCEPNLEFKFNERDGEGTFFTTRDVEQNEELCIQYAGQTDSVLVRQAYFKHYYGFQCKCIKCTEEQQKN